MASGDIFPRRNLPGEAQQWGRAMEREVEESALQLDILRQSVQGLNRSTASSLQTIAGQIQLIQAQQATLEQQQTTLTNQQTQLSNQQTAINQAVADLEDAGQVYSASVGTSWASGSAGWVSSPPSVTASSRSRKFQVTVTGGASGGMGFFTFSASGYDRDRALGSGASAVRARASALGGAGEAGTASRTFIATMPGTGNYTFTAQGRKTDQYVSIIGLEIVVQPLLRT